MKPSAPGISDFEAVIYTARPFVHLRIADDISTAVARLTTGLWGYTLAGLDSHQLDDILNFKDSSHFFSYSFRPAFPGRA